MKRATEKRGGAVLQLVPRAKPPIDEHMLYALLEIVTAVQRGEVVGVALVVRKPGAFFVDVLGKCALDPHATRGHVSALDDELRTRARSADQLDD